MARVVLGRIVRHAPMLELSTLVENIGPVLPAEGQLVMLGVVIAAVRARFRKLVPTATVQIPDERSEML